MQVNYEMSSLNNQTKWKYRLRNILFGLIFASIGFLISLLVINAVDIPLTISKSHPIVLEVIASLGISVKNELDLGPWIIVITGTLVISIGLFSVLKNFLMYKKFKEIEKEDNSPCWQAFKACYEDYCKEESVNKQSMQGEYIEIDHKGFVEEFISKTTYMGESVLNQLRMQKSIPSVLIILGVLGTFIGLVMGLKEINLETLTNYDVNNTEVFENLLDMIGGIHTAFLTSILGIICSLFVQYFWGKHNGEQVLTYLMLKFEMKLNLRKKDYGTKITVEELKKINFNLAHVQEGLLALENLKEASQGLNLCNDKIKTTVNNLDSSLAIHDHVSKVIAENIKELAEEFKGLNKTLENYEESTQKLNMNVNQISDAVDKVISLQEKFELNLEEQLEQVFASQKNQLNSSLNRVIEEAFNKVNKELIAYLESKDTYLQSEISISQQKLDTLCQEQKNSIEQEKLMSTEWEAMIEKQAQLVENVLFSVEAIPQKMQETIKAVPEELKKSQEEIVKELSKIEVQFEDNMKLCVEQITNQIRESIKIIPEDLQRTQEEFLEKFKRGKITFESEVKDIFGNTVNFMELANKLLKKKYENFREMEVNCIKCKSI